MRVVLAGTPATAVTAFEHLLSSSHEVVGVLTRPPARSGRGRTLTPSPLAVAAAEHGLPVLDPDTPNDPSAHAALRDLRPDCVPVVAYGQLLQPATLALAPAGFINLHFSLLPAYRGAAPVQHALLAGEDMTGASTFVIDDGLDTGPIIGVVTEAIRPSDTTGTLLSRLADAGARLLVASLDAIADGTAHPQPQTSDGVSYAPKLTSADLHANPALPALALDRLLRAAAPTPGAWASIDGTRITLSPLAAPAGTPAPERLAIGEVRSFGKDGIWWGTGSTPVRLGRVRPAGKNEMPAEDWWRGRRATGPAMLA